MDKETDALLKIARERENKKDLLAYQKLKEISTGVSYRITCNNGNQRTLINP